MWALSARTFVVWYVSVWHVCGAEVLYSTTSSAQRVQTTL